MNIEDCDTSAWWLENGDGSQKICDCTDEQAQDESSREDEPPSVDVKLNGNAGPSGPNSAIEGHLSANEGSEVVSFPNDGDDGDIVNLAIPWRKLPHRWYLVAGESEMKCKWGWSKLLVLKSANGKCLTVWATGLIKASIGSKWNENPGARLFIKSLGARKSSIGPFSYYDYKYKTVV